MRPCAPCRRILLVEHARRVARLARSARIQGSKADARKTTGTRLKRPRQVGSAEPFVRTICPVPDDVEIPPSCLRPRRVRRRILCVRAAGRAQVISRVRGLEMKRPAYSTYASTDGTVHGR